MEVNEIIKKRREELGLSIRDVASSLNVSPSTVSRYESCDIQNMGIDKIEMLSKVLRCSPVYLMGWDSDVIIQEFRLSSFEKDLISIYRKLNNEGKQKLQERAEELVTLGFCCEKGDCEKMA